MKRILALLLLFMLAAGACAEETNALDSDRPVIALSFDDGPSENTIRILEILKEYGCRATFFMVGNRMSAYEQAVWAVNESDNEIGTHLWDHDDIKLMQDWQLKNNLRECMRQTAEMTGREVRFLRPPYGYVDHTMYSACKSLGLYIVTWTADSLDWKTRNAQMICDEVMKTAANGGIILCHDLYPETAEGLRLFLPKLIEQGYQVVTVGELMDLRAEPMKSTTHYTGVKPSDMRFE